MAGHPLQTGMNFRRTWFDNPGKQDRKQPDHAGPEATDIESRSGETKFYGR
jgi:hypothetical protein